MRRQYMYKLVAVPVDKLDQLPEGTDLLEGREDTPVGNLEVTVETDYGDLHMRIYEGEDGMEVTANISTEEPWVINGIPVAGFYVLSTEHVKYGALSRKDTYEYDTATDAAKRTVKRVCMEAVHNITPSEWQEALVRSRQAARFNTMNYVAQKAAELAERYNSALSFTP
jgi:hypothetical protein